MIDIGVGRGDLHIVGDVVSGGFAIDVVVVLVVLLCLCYCV